MPNHCDINIRISCREESKTVQNMKEMLQDNDDKYLEILTKTDMKAVGKDEDEWCNKNWGTKWDIKDASSECIQDNILKISGWTAWSPPLDALETISATYPDVVIRIWYNEPGNNFKGFALYKKGKEEGNIMHSYYDDEDEVDDEFDWYSEDDSDKEGEGNAPTEVSV